MKHQLPLDTESDLARLLRINFDVVQALEGKKLPPGSRLIYTEALAWKLFGHATTAFHLWRDRTTLDIPGLEFLKQSPNAPAINFVDWTSIQVLARACTEVLLAFNYVYVQPKDADEAEFRYLAWMLAGFSQRESFPVMTDEGKKQVAVDRRVNAKLRRQIERTAAFQALPEDGRRLKEQVLQGRNWHPDKTLSAMCEDVFGPIWGRHLYSFMSSHAHSDALSAVQVFQTSDKAKELGEAALITVSITLARMTAGYAGIWVASRKVYDKHQYRELNDFYLKFAETDPSVFGL
jgi:hypothetical protein